jgi:probable rRNA maturation factor
MILLDPDLGPDLAPDPSPRVKPAKTVAPANLSTRSLALFLRKAQAAVRLRGQVSVLLTTDAAIRKLNRQFRGKNKATDVLSFPAVDLFPVSRSRPGAPADRIAGDLAISVDTAREQAEAFGHSLGTELKVLILHGLLHLAGFDHETDGGEMAKREGALRAKLGLPLGLIERAENSGASGVGGVSGVRKLAGRRVGESAGRRKP